MINVQEVQEIVNSILYTAEQGESPCLVFQKKTIEQLEFAIAVAAGANILADQGIILKLNKDENCINFEKI